MVFLGFARRQVLMFTHKYVPYENTTCFFPRPRHFKIVPIVFDDFVLYTSIMKSSELDSTQRNDLRNFGIVMVHGYLNLNVPIQRFPYSQTPADVR